MIDRNSIRQRFNLFVPAMTLALVASNADAQNWNVEGEASNLGFEVTQLGSPIQGRFDSFDVDITFDPAALDAASVVVTIDLASVNTENGERDTEIRNTAWFDVANHPTATFESESFAQDGDGYMVSGNLTIKGITKPVAMPTTIDIDGDKAVAIGEIAVERTEFEVGTGQWTSGATIGTTVTIRFNVEATAG